MILSGKKIHSLLNKKIYIDPYDVSRLNPNSYNLTLHNQLYVYADYNLNMKKNHEIIPLTIPESGLVLEPQKLYLGRTVEYTKTYDYVPMLEGRSSIGRLGLYVHITAGFGDVGFEGHWTLEMHCIQPIQIFPFIEICQIFYHSIDGDYTPYQSTKYQKNTGVQGSKLYKDFISKDDMQKERG